MSMTEEELNQKTAELEQRQARFNADRLRFELQNALHALKVRPEALADATALMANVYAAEFGDDGRVSALKAGETVYDSVADAATAFVAERSYFAQPADRGKGADETPELPRAPSVAEAFGDRQSDKRNSNVNATQLPKGSVTELLERGYNAGDLISEGWANPPK